MKNAQKLLTLFLFAPVLHAATKELRVIIYPNAQSQLMASRALIAQVGADAGNIDDLRRGVATAVASLEVIPKKWPNDSTAVTEALILEGDLVSAPTIRAYGTGEQVARKGLSVAGSLPEGALFYRILGLSLAGLGRSSEAEQAFKNAESHARMTELSAIDQLSIFEATGDFYDQRSNKAEAAKHYRAASKISGLSEMTTLAMTLASLERAAESDKEHARADLAQLDRLTLLTLQHNHSDPAELAVIRGYQAAAARFHKVLG